MCTSIRKYTLWFWRERWCSGLVRLVGRMIPMERVGVIIRPGKSEWSIKIISFFSPCVCLPYLDGHFSPLCSQSLHLLSFLSPSRSNLCTEDRCPIPDSPSQSPQNPTWGEVPRDNQCRIDSDIVGTESSGRFQSRYLKFSIPQISVKFKIV